MNDLRFAIRQLLKYPSFTFIAVLTLALGIGANTVVFSVTRTVLSRPLGIEDEAGLMWIHRINTQTGAIENQLSWRDVEDIRTLTTAFESVATDNSSDALWEIGDESREVPIVRATPELPEALRLRPSLGRLFLPTDTDPNADPVVLVSHELWKAHFNGSLDILAQTVRLDGKERRIVGVLPPGLRFPIHRAPSAGAGTIVKAGKKPFWIPMTAPEGEDRTSRNARMFLAIARLKSGVTEEAARAELAVLGQRLTAEYPESNRNWKFGIISFRDQIFGQTLQAIPVLAAAVVAVLLICCINLANLLLARGVARQQEMAIRVALGAGRRRLVRSLMMENMLLSLAGGGLGLAFAYGALQIIYNIAAGSVPYILEASVDGMVIAFTGGISLLTTLLFGLVPAIRQSGAEATESLRSGTRTTGSPQVRVWQQSMLVGQIAVVLVLLASAGLLLESFRRLMAQDLGYRPHSVIAMDLKTRGFDSNGDVCRMYRRLKERLAALPGVEAVGTVSSAPLTGKWTFSEKPQVVGHPLAEADRPSLATTFVAFDYFQAMGIPLVDGRFFRDAELEDDGYGQIVILNEAGAATLFPGRSAVGGLFTVGSNPDRVLEVIGVVADTRDVRLEEEPQPRFYWQYAFGGAQIVVRGNAPVESLMPILGDVVQQTDSRLQIADLKPMSDIVDETVAERRFVMLLVTTYAVLALGIAAVGIFGVVGYQVAQRTKEFGVRLAVGARPINLHRLVLSEVGKYVSIGLLIGLAVSVVTNQLLASQLFGLTPHDPWLLTIVCVLMLSVALAASALPAHRAARTNPMEALRAD